MESFEQDRAKAQIFCIFRRRAGDEYASLCKFLLLNCVLTGEFLGDASLLRLATMKAR